jgi:hypothetical protein
VGRCGKAVFAVTLPRDINYTITDQSVTATLSATFLPHTGHSSYRGTLIERKQMYIGAWQEYRLANAFTQPSIERHAQLTEFYGKWLQLCNEQGEQAATKALIFDPLFASVANADSNQQQNQSHYQLEQEGGLGQSGVKWRLGNGGSKSAGSQKRGQQFVRQGVRTVQKRKENYMQSMTQNKNGGAVPSSRASISAQSSKTILSGARRLYLDRENENIPPIQKQKLQKQSKPSNITRSGSTERVLTANPKRYVPAATEAELCTIPAISSFNTDTTVTRSTFVVPHATPSSLQQEQEEILEQQQRLQEEEYYHRLNLEQQQQRRQQQRQQQQQQQQSNQFNQSAHQPQQFQQLQMKQRPEIHEIEIQNSNNRIQTYHSPPPLQPRSPLNVVTVPGTPASGVRPRSTHSVASLSSPHVWEQEVDDLLKW